LKYIFLLFLFSSAASFGQNIENLQFGSDSTLDIMTWNIEAFPKAGQNTMDSVGKIVEALDMDIIGVQEINDTNAFKAMVLTINGYSGFAKLNYLVGLGFIYKTSSIQINSIYEIFTAPQYWNNFPRAPIVMDMNYMNERYILIVNHLKCCGDGFIDLGNTNDEENRRLESVILLKEYIDQNFPTLKTIVLGDLNDLITDQPNSNVFQPILNDPSNYAFADNAIALGPSSNWSYPTWPSHLDHFIITNELFYETQNNGSNVQTLKLESEFAAGWSSYEAIVSDHRPVAMKIFPDMIGEQAELIDGGYNLTIYPNPSNGDVHFTLGNPMDEGSILIHAANGTLITDARCTGKFTWETQGSVAGIYYATLTIGNTIIKHQRIILL
jgi:endonuclease/exonuclease/phosphatase family metal-dependent hydrolase